MTTDFTNKDNFKEEHGFTGVQYGANAPLLDIELNEMQKIQQEQWRKVIKSFFPEDSVVGRLMGKVVDGKMMLANTNLVIDGELFYVDEMTLEMTEEQREFANVFVMLKEIVITAESIVYKNGNLNKKEEIPNTLVSDLAGFETSRRTQLVYDMTFTQSDPSAKYFKIGEIRNGYFIGTANKVTPGGNGGSSGGQVGGFVTYTTKDLRGLISTKNPLGMEFSMKVFEGSNFSNIEFINSEGTENVLTKATLSEDGFSIELVYVEDLLPNHTYFGKIPAKAFKDRWGNDIPNIYEFEFVTESVVTKDGKLTDLTTDGTGNGILIGWKTPERKDIKQVDIYRSKLKFPTSIEDIQPVGNSTGEEYRDTDVEPHVKYYYSLVPVDSIGEKNIGNFIYGTLGEKTTGEDVPPTIDLSKIVEDGGPVVDEHGEVSFYVKPGGEITSTEESEEVIAYVELDRWVIRSKSDDSILYEIGTDGSIFDLEGNFVGYLEVKYSGGKGIIISKEATYDEVNTAFSLLQEGDKVFFEYGDYDFDGEKLEIKTSNVEVYGNQSTIKAGIYFTGTEENPLTGIKISEINVIESKDMGISLVYVMESTITGNTASNNNNTGIYLNSSSNNTITGNTASNNTNSHGILLTNSSNNTITGNTANNNTSHGILLTNSSNNTITGNTASSNTSNGIVLNNYSKNSTVTGNTANNNNSYGIYLYTSSSNNTITGNTVINNTSHGILLNSSSNDCIITSNQGTRSIAGNNHINYGNIQ